MFYLYTLGTEFPSGYIVIQFFISSFALTNQGELNLFTSHQLRMHALLDAMWSQRG